MHLYTHQWKFSEDIDIFRFCSNKSCGKDCKSCFAYYFSSTQQTDWGQMETEAKYLENDKASFNTDIFIFLK